MRLSTLVVHLIDVIAHSGMRLSAGQARWAAALRDLPTHVERGSLDVWDKECRAELDAPGIDARATELLALIYDLAASSLYVRFDATAAQRQYATIAARFRDAGLDPPDADVIYDDY